MTKFWEIYNIAHMKGEEHFWQFILSNNHLDSDLEKLNN